MRHQEIAKTKQRCPIYSYTCSDALYNKSSESVQAAGVSKLNDDCTSLVKTICIASTLIEEKLSWMSCLWLPRPKSPHSKKAQHLTAVEPDYDVTQLLFVWKKKHSISWPTLSLGPRYFWARKLSNCSVIAVFVSSRFLTGWLGRPHMRPLIPCTEESSLHDTVLCHGKGRYSSMNGSGSHCD